MRTPARLRERVGGVILVVLPLVFLGYFFAYPLGAILSKSLLQAGRVDLTPFADVFRRGTLRNAIWFTVWQATASMLLTLVVALPTAYVFARYRFPGKNLLRAAITVPFVLPTVVVGTAFLALLGPTGLIDLSGTVWLILIAHVFFNYAIVVRTVGGFWANLDPRLEEAARMLGAGRWRTFRTVTLPLLRPALAAAGSIVFLFTFTSFGVILILGGLRFATIEVEIWRQTISYLQLPIASALAVIQLVGVTSILFAYSRYQQRRMIELPLRPAQEVSRTPRTLRDRAIVGITLGFTGLFLGTPLAVLIERSLRTDAGFGLAAYRSLATPTSALFVPPVEAIRNSILFAFAATVIAVTVGMAAAAIVAYRTGLLSRAFDVLLMLPLGTSAVTIGFGFLVALGRPVDLRTSPVLIPIAHALVAIPFVVRTAVPVMRSVKEKLREAAAMLGAPPSRVWRRIDLPMVFRAGLVGAGFAFAISLGEFGATSFIARPATPTLPIAIFRLLGRPGTLDQALALATVLMVLTALSILLIERFRFGELGDF
ncbi:MAG: iron ABC transporter permease [Actinobacteria bacterium]|nr:iron ABC transporter permease [Actinomycetota bacterium]